MRDRAESVGVRGEGKVKEFFLDRVFCGLELPDGNRCSGVHTATRTYDANGDVIIVTITCTNKYCIYREIVPERRKEKR